MKCATYSASTVPSWCRLRISIRSSSSRRTQCRSIVRHCVRLGCQHRCAQDADNLAGEHGIEYAGELAVTISDQEPELSLDPPIGWLSPCSRSSCGVSGSWVWVIGRSARSLHCGLRSCPGAVVRRGWRGGRAGRDGIGRRGWIPRASAVVGAGLGGWRSG